MNKRKYSAFEVRDFLTAGALWDALSPTKKIDPNCSVDNIVYRGQGDSVWGLIPSILRNHPAKNNLNVDPMSQDYVAEELAILNSFVKHCDRTGVRIPNDSQKFRRSHLEPIKQTPWLVTPSLWPNFELLDLMALAQHHGVPTRLLDWTRLAYTAFYFAVQQCLANYKEWRADSKLAIWALNVEMKNLHPNIIIHTSAGSISPHLAAQYGLFTVHPHNGGRDHTSTICSLEEFTTDLENPIFFKYTLPASESFNALELLNKAGFSAADIYPTADGAGRAIQDEINAKRANAHFERITLQESDK